MNPSRNDVTRCRWCSADPVYQHYHDHEWGVPEYDAQRLFEKLLLDGFQAGLSWITILKKRERYRQVYRGFDVQLMAAQSDADLQILMQDPGIIRNRLKIQAARQNARAWLVLAKRTDPAAWLWQFVDGRPLINQFASHAEVPAITPQAQAMSKALKKAGFSFVGPTICYAFMQATGMVMDHTLDCFRYAELGCGTFTVEQQ
ncbi:DNA-3-methyladenine glycosylase I [Halopseudomonas litoralis]|uniref:DNA-3-methyladenine glycosylase I n=1 Tax=Halopseudomonas litoralis TaxID=797277 RepID=A0A1H1WXU0_9GAMM|nr:DNA-3-methyladenine glycosylase I [Halopseudomonas litoralis]SDT01905.1 DNA-3-methyladenine glycosylase I [Halopseudomonas litoralis]